MVSGEDWRSPRKDLRAMEVMVVEWKSSEV